MITDRIENAERYYGLGDGIEKALRFVQEDALTDISPGRYEIVDNDVFALVQQYKSRLMEDCTWEAHREYVDVQYIISGEEKIGYAQLSALEIVKEYDKESDSVLLRGNGCMLSLCARSFAIFGPNDAHMPCISAHTEVLVKKVVVKVRI
jgi:YhcH/YjgK/YiaL family protein